MDQQWWVEVFLEVGNKGQQMAEEYLEIGNKGPERLALKWVQTERKSHSAVALPGVDGQKAPLLQGEESEEAGYMDH